MTRLRNRAMKKTCNYVSKNQHYAHDASKRIREKRINNQCVLINNDNSNIQTNDKCNYSRLQTRRFQTACNFFNKTTKHANASSDRIHYISCE